MLISWSLLLNIVASGHDSFLLHLHEFCLTIGLVLIRNRLRWFNFFYHTAVLFTLDQYSKFLNLFQLIVWCTSIFKLTSYVGISIHIEAIVSTCVFHKNFYIYLSDTLIVVQHFQFTELLKDLYFQWTRIECLKNLFSNCIDFNYKILCHELLWYFNRTCCIFTLFCCNCFLNFKTWFDKSKLFCVVFEERCTREKNFSINHVVLDFYLFNIDRFNFKGSFLINLTIWYWRLFIFTFFKTFLFLLAKRRFWFTGIVCLIHTVKFTIKVIKLVFNSQKHGFPIADWVVVISLYDSSCKFITIFRPSKEIKVSTEIVILDF